MASIFRFDWPVDRDGYEIEHRGPTGDSLLGRVEYDVIRRRGGPDRNYRPLEDHPGLWRRFAETCSTVDGVLKFVTQFGLLSDVGWETPDSILNTAELIRQIAANLDDGDSDTAADLFTKYAKPNFSAGIRPKGSGKARYESELIPVTLRSALLLQTLETITGDRQWRRCRNEGCLEWFQLGPGAHTSRREFCSDRCRVASARRNKEASHA